MYLFALASSVSEDGQLDSGIDMPVQSNQPKSILVTKSSGNNAQSDNFGPISNTDYPLISLDGSDSLGHKRPAPQPPRRTTPVKPLSSFTSLDHDLIHTDGLNDLMLPPPPSPKLINQKIDYHRNPNYHLGSSTTTTMTTTISSTSNSNVRLSQPNFLNQMNLSEVPTMIMSSSG